MSDRWYVEGDFWRRDDGDGVHDERDDGTGDFIFNHCSKCVMDEDTSDWAVNSFFGIANLLEERKRWPDRLNVGGEAVTRVAWYVYKYLNIGGPWKYRSQNDMTRDPHIAFGAFYETLLGANDGIYDEELQDRYESIKIPAYLYRPDTWAWRKRLIEDDSKFFVKRLRYLRALAVVKNFERDYKIWNDGDEE